MSQTEFHAWPIVFRHRGTLLGKGFLADIEIQGRLLARPESDGVWMDGVNPGALAFGAKTLNETKVELRTTLAKVFIDFAQQTSTFDEFKARVEEFFNETDDATLAEWDAAVDNVKAGRVASPDGVPVVPDADCYVRVTEKSVESVTPQDNSIVQQESQDRYYSYEIAA